MHLRLADIRNCVSVCKAWHTIFIPQLYGCFEYRSSYSPDSAFHKYGHHMRILQVLDSEFPDPERFGPECRLLTKLNISGKDEALSVECRQHLTALIDNNTDIHTLGLCLDAQDELISDLKLLTRTPALKDLELSWSRIERATTFDEILECGPKLDRLLYRPRDDIAPMSIFKNSAIALQESRTMWKLSSLTVGSFAEFGIELLKYCPNLRHFSSTATDQTQYIQQLIQHHHDGYPSRLRHLQLYGWDRAQPELFLAFLKGCAESSGLKTMELMFFPIANDIITGFATLHAHTLEKVYLYTPKLEESSSYDYSVNVLLSACPNLRHLVLLEMMVSMEDLVQSTWACKHLQVLRVHIQGNQVIDQDHQPMTSDQVPESFQNTIDLRRRVWNQIAEMTNLWELYVHNDYNMVCPVDCTHIEAGGKVLCNLNTLTFADGGLESLCKLHRLT
ncbi:hypothetical protein BGZ65_002161, partial [Modicella reniformis]